MTAVLKFRTILAIALAIGAAGCVPTPVQPSRAILDDVFGIDGNLRAADARAGFRRIFCDLVEAQAAQGADRASCDSLLRELPPEEGELYPQLADEENRERFAMLIVPGLGQNCFKNLVGEDFELVRYAESRGHVVRVAGVDGLESTEQNAAALSYDIRELHEASESRRLIILSYSKGTNDVLEALVEYPDLARRVTAVIGLASAVGGSPLAPTAPHWAFELFARIPGANCGAPPADALPSLYPDVRQQWIAEHELPESIAYFSVVSLPQPENIAPLLRVSYKKLADFDPYNDGQVIARDQVIPGSRVLAFVNADHWAIALPVSRVTAMSGSTLLGGGEFPRHLLLEAIWRYVEIAVGSEA